MRKVRKWTIGSKNTCQTCQKEFWASGNKKICESCREKAKQIK
jgi:Zn finger protein HypA/HybF involved in hydrogenase expression